MNKTRKTSFYINFIDDDIFQKARKVCNKLKKFHIEKKVKSEQE